MHDIFNRLTAMGKRINVAIFFHGDILGEWAVNLTWQEGNWSNSDTKLEIKRRNADLETALRNAWNDLEQIAKKGLDKGALVGPNP